MSTATSDILNEKFEYEPKHSGLFIKKINDHFVLQDNWIIKIENQRFDYSAGIGHRKKHPLADKKSRDYQLAWGSLQPKQTEENFENLKEIVEKTSFPNPPHIDDVLFCIVMDSSAKEMTFEQWCEEFDDNPDSRKALAAYLECQENAGKLQHITTKSLDGLRELFQDY